MRRPLCLLSPAMRLEHTPPDRELSGPSHVNGTLRAAQEASLYSRDDWRRLDGTQTGEVFGVLLRGGGIYIHRSLSTKGADTLHVDAIVPWLCVIGGLWGGWVGGWAEHRSSERHGNMLSVTIVAEFMCKGGMT